MQSMLEDVSQGALARRTVRKHRSGKNDVGCTCGCRVGLFSHPPIQPRLTYLRSDRIGSDDSNQQSDKAKTHGDRQLIIQSTRLTQPPAPPHQQQSVLDFLTTQLSTRPTAQHTPKRD